MAKTIEYYFLSCIGIILQFLFLSIVKEYDEDFLKYIEITVLSQTIISIFGSIQFYIYKKNNRKTFNINKTFLYIFILSIILISIFYLFENFLYFIFFITTLGSLGSLLLNTAIFSRFNLQRFSTYYLYLFTLFKTSILYFAFKMNLNFYYSLIFINLLLILTLFIFKMNITIKKDGFSLLSLINNFFGSGITTIDKLYCNKFLTFLAADYYIIFRLSSIIQYLTELMFRKERFEITSGIENINNRNLYMKIVICLIFIIFSFIFLENLSLLEPLILQYNLNLIFSLLVIAQQYTLEFVFVSLGFLLNGISGLRYDFIYSKYSQKKLMIINSSNFLLFMFLIFISSTIFHLCLAFLFVQIFNYLIVKMYEKKLKVL